MYDQTRSAPVAITVFGAIINAALAIQVLAAWRSLRWEPESEWEAPSDVWRVDGVKIIWGLLSAYFATSASICVVGLFGIIRSKPSLVRFYRDYSIADFSFCTFTTAVTAYAVFHSSARATICEELSRHPELMTDLAEMGLNLENCERWLERAVLASVALMVVVIVIRLHFLLAVSNLHSKLIRQHYSTSYTRSHSRFRQSDSNPLQRIYLLPPPPHSPYSDDVELVYTPVPLSSLPENLRTSATEAWVSRSNSRSEGGGRRSRAMSDSSTTSSQVHYSSSEQEQQHRQQRHHRRHSHGHHRHSSRSSSRTGTIRLPISPNEGLLPPYYGEIDSKV